jgi:rubrerythrin
MVPIELALALIALAFFAGACGSWCFWLYVMQKGNKMCKHIPVMLTYPGKQPEYLCQECGKEMSRKDWEDHFGFPSEDCEYEQCPVCGGIRKKGTQDE